MFVRKRASGNQLLETYRDGNKVRQRVVCNLGPHETPEAALAGTEVELEGLTADARALEDSAARMEAIIQEIYREGLEKWHGGEVPPLEEAIDKAREAMPRTTYGEEHLASDIYESEYAWDFGGFNLVGETVHLGDFILHLRALEDRRAEAHVARDKVAPKEGKLRERIATLREVLGV